MDDRGVYAWQHSVTWTTSAAPIVISKEGAHSLHGIAKREERKSQVSYRVTPPKKKAVILINIQSDSYDGIHTKVLPSSAASLLSPLIMPVLNPSVDSFIVLRFSSLDSRCEQTLFAGYDSQIAIQD
jgi:hypothetical protein